MHKSLLLNSKVSSTLFVTLDCDYDEPEPFYVIVPNPGTVVPIQSLSLTPTHCCSVFS